MSANHCENLTECKTFRALRSAKKRSEAHFQLQLDFNNLFSNIQTVPAFLLDFLK